MIPDPVLIHEWHPVAGARGPDDDRPLAARLLGENLVLWRAGDRWHAWRDLCIHRGASLSLGRVAGACLHCPYHGWVYNEDGQCVTIPAHPHHQPPIRAHAKVYRCRAAYGWVWVCLSDEPAPFPKFPEWNGAGQRSAVCGPYTVRASAPRVIENFLDLAHLPIVHAGILGEESRPEIGPYQVRKTAAGIDADEIVIWQPDPDGSGCPAPAHYTYRVIRPLTAYLAKVAGPSRFTMMISAMPVTELETKAWIAFAMAGADETPLTTVLAWTERVFLQDIPIVESQRPERLPLDLQSELHLNSDRTSIAYRQWLRELGLTFGTS